MNRLLAAEALTPPPGSNFVVFDQRGAGYSEPDFCRAIAPPWLRGVPMWPNGEDVFRAELRRCLDEARAQGVDVDAYSTWHNAHDVRDLRRALGLLRWNLLGGSYGALLGQAVMRVDAAGTRAAVLDSAPPLVVAADNPAGNSAFGLRSSLTAVARACAADERCRADVPDLTERLEAQLAAYDAQPLVLESVADAVRVVLDGQTLASLVFAALYDARAYPDLPIFLKALESRDAEALEALASVVVLPLLSDRSFGTGLNLVATCRSDLRSMPAALRDSEPLRRWVLTPARGDPGIARCNAVYRVDPDASVSALESAIPTLVLSGEADPVTPPGLARTILPGLSRATFIEVPRMGHGVLPSLAAAARDCADRMLAAFIAEPGVEIESACVRALSAPPFVTRVHETKRPLRLLEAMRRTGVPAVAVGGALALGGLLLAAVVYPLAAIARRIEGQTDRAARRPRILAWVGALVAVLGAVVAAAAFGLTLTNHILALPVGVLPWAVWGGGLALLGTLLCITGTVEYFRRRDRTKGGSGTELGLCVTTACAAGLAIFLALIGAGPI
jgi:pimeloyl-ACP methyl ester carboxylesterase